MSKNIGKQLHGMAKRLADMQKEMTALLDDERLDSYEVGNLSDARDGIMSALTALGGIVDTSDVVSAFGELVK